MTSPQVSMASSYTRNELSAATAVPGEMLAYWIKLGLIVPRTDSAGKGKHRRFGFEAIHIGALLAELSRYGMNGAALRRAASRLGGRGEKSLF